MFYLLGWYFIRVLVVLTPYFGRIIRVLRFIKNSYINYFLPFWLPIWGVCKDLLLGFFIFGGTMGVATLAEYGTWYFANQPNPVYLSDVINALPRLWEQYAYSVYLENEDPSEVNSIFYNLEQPFYLFDVSQAPSMLNWSKFKGLPLGTSMYLPFDFEQYNFLTNLFNEKIDKRTIKDLLLVISSWYNYLILPESNIVKYISNAYHGSIKLLLKDLIYIFHNKNSINSFSEYSSLAWEVSTANYVSRMEDIYRNPSIMVPLVEDMNSKLNSLFELSANQNLILEIARKTMPNILLLDPKDYLLLSNHPYSADNMDAFVYSFAILKSKKFLTLLKLFIALRWKFWYYYDYISYISLHYFNFGNEFFTLDLWLEKSQRRFSYWQKFLEPLAVFKDHFYTKLYRTPQFSFLNLTLDPDTVINFKNLSLKKYKFLKYVSWDKHILINSAYYPNPIQYPGVPLNKEVVPTLIFLGFLALLSVFIDA